jgi:dihydroxy-acid dehydratase
MTNISRGKAFFEQTGVAGFTHRAFTKSMGFDDEDMHKPVIGICNTFSEVNNCHRHFRELCEAVKRGVWQAGGFPLEFPTISLGEIYLNPTSMLYRNLAAMDTEEMIRGQPLDGVVLLVNCDKSIAASMMGAASADLPAIILSGGPMLNGRYRDQILGACTDCRRLTAENQAGKLDDSTYHEIEDGIVRSAGHCMVMGTASTMNSICEAMGISLPGNGAIPAVDSRRLRLAESAGRQIVTLAQQNIRPSQILTGNAFHNAITLMCAVGGSTNAFIHLAAVAGRLGIDLPLSLFDEISRKTPLIASLRPAGNYQMEDLYYAGGIPAILKELLPLLHGDAMTVTGNTLAENVRDAVIHDNKIIHSLADPISTEGGLAVLWGNLAPDGAVIKHAAASPHLLKHKGRAVVFKDMADLTARINDPNLDVEKNDVLVLQNVGPVGAPGMPEVGNFPIPGKLLSRGVRDMVRISDARMSGTAFGTIVLHVAPESAIGGPLALVMDGDEIELDVSQRSIVLHVSEAELTERRSHWQPPSRQFERGYGKLYIEHVLQAPQGCDFDFLCGATPVEATEQPKF